jgi:hypothetical protein
MPHSASLAEVATKNYVLVVSGGNSHAGLSRPLVLSFSVYVLGNCHSMGLQLKILVSKLQIRMPSKFLTIMQKR